MFAKIFNQIFNSSIAEDYSVRHVFMDLLVLADQDGVVDMTLEAISRRTNVPLEIVDNAISKLSQSDPQSRSDLEEGKRICLIDSHRDWGWQIVNYHHYRSLVDDESRRAYFRDRQREYRAAKSKLSNPVKDKIALSKMSKKITQAEAEAEAEAEKQKQGASAFSIPNWIPVKEWEAFIEQRKKLRKAPTDRAKELLVKKLQAMGGDTKAILEQSIVNGWQDVFPLRGNGNGQSIRDTIRAAIRS